MMIRCPKCSFEQPDEQYCAACGVDMKSFEKKRPLSEKITKNSFTYLFLFFSILVGTTFFIKNNWFSNDWSNLDFQPAQQKQEREAASLPSEQPQIPFSSSDKSDLRQAISQEPRQENPYLEIKVLELPTNLIAYLLDRDLLAEDFNQFSIVVPEALRLQEVDFSAYSQVYSEKYYLNAFKSPLRIQQSVYDETLDDDLGFILEFSVNTFRSEEVSIDISLNRNFYESEQDGASSLWQKINETLNFREGSAYLLMGILPQRPLHPSETNLFRDGYLGLMNASEYAQGEITMAVLLRYSTDKDK
tara:strand:- start:728 stop:1636 length:909 start_codon:yes stop_codon:yes gene_type:complete